jgi:hypothetical protein
MILTGAPTTHAAAALPPRGPGTPTVGGAMAVRPRGGGAGAPMAHGPVADGPTARGTGLLTPCAGEIPIPSGAESPPPRRGPVPTAGRLAAHAGLTPPGAHAPKTPGVCP